MTFELKDTVNPREIYDYMMKLTFPYKYEVEYHIWEKSYLYDMMSTEKAGAYSQIYQR